MTLLPFGGQKERAGIFCVTEGGLLGLSNIMGFPVVSVGTDGKSHMLMALGYR